MDRRVALVAMVLPGLVACGARSRGYASDGYLTSTMLLLPPLKRIEGSVSVPAVGASGRVSVGSPIVSVTNAYWDHYVTLSGEPLASWTDEEKISYELKLPTGKFLIGFEDSQSRYYFSETRGLLRAFWQGKPYDDYEVSILCRADASGKLSVLIRYVGEPEIAIHEVQGASLIRSREGPYDPQVKVRRELIYTGKAGRNLGLMYREFRDDMARPAFFQQLQYDTETDPIIGYQSARFRVLSATNTELSYEVLATLSL